MKKDCPSAYQEFIGKPEVNFWVPIIFTAVSITISFMALSNQVALQNQKLDTVIANQQQILVESKDMRKDITMNSTDISILKSKNDDKTN
jgi:hypothetical protein